MVKQPLIINFSPFVPLVQRSLNKKIVVSEPEGMFFYTRQVLI